MKKNALSLIVAFVIPALLMRDVSRPTPPYLSRLNSENSFAAQALAARAGSIPTGHGDLHSGWTRWARLMVPTTVFLAMGGAALVVIRSQMPHVLPSLIHQKNSDHDTLLDRLLDNQTPVDVRGQWLEDYVQHETDRAALTRLLADLILRLGTTDSEKRLVFYVQRLVVTLDRQGQIEVLTTLAREAKNPGQVSRLRQFFEDMDKGGRLALLEAYRRLSYPSVPPVEQNLYSTLDQKINVYPAEFVLLAAAYSGHLSDWAKSDDFYRASKKLLDSKRKGKASEFLRPQEGIRLWEERAYLAAIMIVLLHDLPNPPTPTAVNLILDQDLKTAAILPASNNPGGLFLGTSSMHLFERPGEPASPMADVFFLMAHEISHPSLWMSWREALPSISEMQTEIASLAFLQAMGWSDQIEAYERAALSRYAMAMRRKDLASAADEHDLSLLQMDTFIAWAKDNGKPINWLDVYRKFSQKLMKNRPATFKGAGMLLCDILAPSKEDTRAKRYRFYVPTFRRERPARPLAGLLKRFS